MRDATSDICEDEWFYHNCKDQIDWMIILILFKFTEPYSILKFAKQMVFVLNISSKIQWNKLNL